MIISDLPLLCLVILLAAYPSGPIGVITVASFLVHFLHGSFRPRIQYVTVYATFPVAAATVVCGGLFAASPPLLFTVIISFSVVVAIVLDWLLPGVQSLPLPQGGLSTACAIAHVQLPQADFMLRVYYPTRPTRAAERLPYLVHGSGSTKGLAKFMKWPSALFDWLRYVKSPVFIADPDEAMIATSEEVARSTRGTSATTTGRSRGTSRDLPVVVFSHGLGGMPDCYTSSVIVDWVSRGYVVFAPEHADGSAAFTAFPDGFQAPYVPLTPEERTNRVLEYKRRHAQLKQRAREITACIDIAESVAAFEMPLTGSSMLNDEHKDVLFLKLLLCDRLDVDHGVCVCGHSFGAATCLAAADKDLRIGVIIAIDPWMFPLSPFLLQRGLPATPVLSISGDGFCAWRENAAAVKLLLSKEVRLSHSCDDGAHTDDLPKRNKVCGVSQEESSGDHRGNGVNRNGELESSIILSGLPHPGNVLLHLCGSEHQDFNDFSLLLGWVGRRMGLLGPVGYALAWRALQEASARFVDVHLAARIQPDAPYEYVVGDYGALLRRDDGPVHSEACKLRHGNVEERYATAQDQD